MKRNQVGEIRVSSPDYMESDPRGSGSGIVWKRGIEVLKKLGSGYVLEACIYNIIKVFIHKKTRYEKKYD